MPSSNHAPLPTLVMAFDFGLKRVGVAFGNRFTKTAQGVAVIDTEEEKLRFTQIEALIKEWQPDALLVGVPRSVEGDTTELTKRCERFARQLTGRFDLPCSTVDERYTSVIVESCMGGKMAREHKGRIDMGSACLILEQFFAEGR